MYCDVLNLVLIPIKLVVFFVANDPLILSLQCNIVYGTVGAFAADILRHEFEKVNIRGDRRCDAIVVDEIDYMTLDQGTQVFFSASY